MASIKVCPNCGSDRVNRDANDLISTMGLDIQYRCDNCGYTGKLFPEVPEDEIDEYVESVDTDAEFEPVERSFSNSRAIMGALLVLLGLGSIPMARISLHGVIGALLIPIGLNLLWKEWKNR